MQEWRVERLAFTLQDTSGEEDEQKRDRCRRKERKAGKEGNKGKIRILEIHPRSQWHWPPTCLQGPTCPLATLSIIPRSLVPFSSSSLSSSSSSLVWTLSKMLAPWTWRNENRRLNESLRESSRRLAFSLAVLLLLLLLLLVPHGRYSRWFLLCLYMDRFRQWFLFLNLTLPMMSFAFEGECLLVLFL